MDVRLSLRRAAVLAALASVTVPLSACGGGGNTQAWVGTFCGAGLSLRTVLIDANTHLKSQLAANVSPGTIGLSVTEDARRIAAAANAARTRIQEAGDPSVPNGEYIQMNAVTLYDGIVSDANFIPNQVGSLAGADAAVLTSRVGPYSQQVTNLSRTVAGSFTRLGSGKGPTELEEVSRKADPETHVDETCAKLQAPAP